MRANEIPIGSGFLGSIDSDDWRENFKAGKPIDGQLIGVTAMVPVASYGSQYLRELLNLHANHLTRHSGSQLCNSFSLWVVGVRESRSAKVRLFDWMGRRSESHLEEVHKLLHEGRILDLTHKLETMRDKEVPYQ